MRYYEKIKNLFQRRINLNKEGRETISFGNIGASINEIENISRNVIDLIPSDYIEFLKNWNGCALFDLKQQSGFVFFSTNEIESETNGFREMYGNEWDDSIILFCSVVGSGDFIGFRTKTNSYEIIDCCHEDLPQYWNVISTSFDDFINQIIDNKGTAFWLD